MCCEPRHLTVALNAALKVAGLKHTAVYVPAEDFESEDDEIELHLLGASINLAVQVGPFGLGLIEYTYKNGKLDGMRTVKNFDRRATPYQVVEAVMVELKKRLVMA